MKLNLNNLLFALSQALDMVEHQMIGVQSAHGKHVAYLSYLMAREYGMSGDELKDFVGCALLHDNAFTEYAREELNGGAVVDADELRERVELLTGEEYMHLISGSEHSVAGEENIRLLPFKTDISNVILFHHENADGTGPMGKTAAETNLKSQIVHVADAIDVTWNLLQMTEKDFDKMYRCVAKRAGTFFSEQSAEIFKKAVSFSDIQRLQAEGAEKILRREMPSEDEEYSDEQIKKIAAFFAGIVDCKSSFIKNHSLGVAEKAEKLSRFYGFDNEKCIRMYLAGSLHDIGKLMIQNDILDKQGRLSESEFTYVKNHASATFEVLRKVEGIEDITEWASRHHEKLNGSGYPVGLTAENLSLEDRMMTCADIYQALTEPRPYKAPMKHEKAISIMKDMVGKGEIDGKIVDDLDIIFKNE